MNVKDYIEQHNSIHYCEAIIYPNGDIENAIPSHIYKLISITGKSKKEINKLMPINASPLEWLLGYTNCISVWYNFFKYDFISNEQINTVQELVNHGILINGIIGYYTDELDRCNLINEDRIDELSDRPNKKIQIWRNVI